MQATKNVLRRVGAQCSAVLNHAVTGLALDAGLTGTFGYWAFHAAVNHQPASAAVSGVFAVLWARNLPRDFRRVSEWNTARSSRYLS